MNEISDPIIAQEIARQLMSPSVQWVNWVVLLAIVAVSALIHVLISWLKKSAEIKAVTERLDEVVEQVAATTRVQEEIKQGMADSIWKDQRRWEAELDLYRQFLITLGNKRKLCMEMKRTNPEDDAFDVLLNSERDLAEEHTKHFQLARMLMPAERFIEFRDILTRNLGNPIFDDPPEDADQFHRMLDAQIEVLVDAENALATHARHRLGTDVDIAER